MEKKKPKVLLPLLFLVVLFGGFCCVSAASPAGLASRFLSNLLGALLRRLWSLTPTTRNALVQRPNVRFESGYHVETVFDGSKLGIEPFSVEVTRRGELLVLDSENSNVYKISLPLSKYSRPKLVAGSAAGYTGHIDGKPREARMSNPKGIAVDDKGNIYIADTKNKAIRKISDTGVTTIAGGKSNKGAHVDGPSGDAKFSNDFVVIYVSTSCSLLVVDRGNQAIREIQLHFDDCAYQYGAGIPLGIAVLFASSFFGYMLAMLQRRWATVVSSVNDPTPTKASYISSPYQHLPKSSVAPALIRPEGDMGRKEGEEGLFTSTKRLVVTAASSLSLIFRGMFLRRGLQSHHQNHQQRFEVNAWPSQESFMVPNEEPPPVESQTPNARKTYAFMSKNQEKLQQLRQGRAYFSGWDGEPPPQQQLQKLRQHYSGPQTYYEPCCETEEVVFGAVQESDAKYERMEIKAVNYGDSFYDQYGPRHQPDYMGYCNDY